MRHDERLWASRVAAVCVISCFAAACDEPKPQPTEASIPAPPGVADPVPVEPRAPEAGNEAPSAPGEAAPEAGTAPGAPDPSPAPPDPVEPAHPAPTCATPASVDGIGACIQYARDCEVPLDLDTVACGFGQGGGQAVCACGSGDHEVRCKQDDSGVTCTRR